MNVISNQRGISLIETLVALGIVAVISMALAQMMKDSINATNYSESKFEEIEMARQLQMQLSLKPGCEQNFKDKQIQLLDPNKYGFLLNPVMSVLGGVTNTAVNALNSIMGIDNFNTVIDSNGRPMLSVGDTIGNRSLKITGLGFHIESQDWTNFQSVKGSLPANSKGAVTMGNLIVSGERVKTSYGGKTFTRAFPIRVLLDANGKVNGCYTDTDAAADAAVTIINNQITQVVNNTINQSTTLVNNTTVNNVKKGCDVTGMNGMGWFACLAMAFFSGAMK
ncbi:MAG: prepilin-type N-terminal cleavage/methylation domain-containing protein [Bdellovibrionales bacterium]|nr:prepilin-type N-terminal cleavage/methylation domain-containing protein [Bdellovibrionales bacterium]